MKRSSGNSRSRWYERYVHRKLELSVLKWASVHQNQIFTNYVMFIKCKGSAIILVAGMLNLPDQCQKQQVHTPDSSKEQMRFNPNTRMLTLACILFLYSKSSPYVLHAIVIRLLRLPASSVSSFNVQLMAVFPWVRVCFYLSEQHCRSEIQKIVT